MGKEKAILFIFSLLHFFFFSCQDNNSKLILWELLQFFLHVSVIGACFEFYFTCKLAVFRVILVAAVGNTELEYFICCVKTSL